jgi:hypothetical protein
MEELPKIVAAQLAKEGGNPPLTAEPHPDPDLLTAFVERSLPERERGDVIGHLANCAACREIVALTQPELEATQPVFVPKLTGSRGRLLRWGLFATCATLALGVVLRQAKDVRPSVVAVKRAPESAALPAEPDRAESRANSAPAQFGRYAELRSRVPEPPAKPPAKKALTLDGSLQPSAGQFGARVESNATPATGATSEQVQVTVNGRAYADAPVVAAPEVAKKATSEKAVSEDDLKVDQRSDQYSSVTVAPKPSEAVAGLGGFAAGDVHQEIAQAEVADKAKAKGKDRDKDAKEELHASSAPIAVGALSLSRSARQAALWQLTSAGELQRSFDSGKGWESVSLGQSVRLRVLALSGWHVWAGGNGGLLFHSRDGGDHFALVVVKDAHATLAGDIVVLEFDDVAHGRLETAGHEVWATSDGGQTWQKQ